MTNRLKDIILISDSSSEEKSIVSYDPYTGNQLNVYKKAGSIAPHSLQVLRDSYILAASLTKPRLYLWPLNSQIPVSEVHLPTPGKVSALACTSNGKFAVAAINEKLFVWQVCSGRLLVTLSGHFQLITTIRFNADGSLFASAGEDNIIFIWSLGGCVNNQHLPEDSTKPLHTFTNHSRPVKDICFGSLTKRSILCSVSLDKTLKIYDTSAGCLLLSLIFNEPLTSVCMDASENFVFIGTTNGNIRQFSLRDPPRTIDYVATNKDVKVFKSHEVAISCLSVSPDCMTLLSADDSGQVCLWNIATGVVTKKLSNKGRISNAEFSKAYENYRSSVLMPSLNVGSLQWSSEVNDNGRLEIVCEDGWEDLLDYNSYVKCNELNNEPEIIENKLIVQNEELKRINNALKKKLMNKLLSDK